MKGERQSPGPERADAVVVGARVSGCAAAIALAKAGRRVIVLDRATFPSNVVSTHGVWPNTIAELSKLGALDRVLAHDPPRIRQLLFAHLGVTLQSPVNAIDGFDYGICLPRPEFDQALVETARAAGVDVREQVSVSDVVWRDGRVVGVRWRRGGGGEAPAEEGEIVAPLTIGADGRRSTIARCVGVNRPYRGSRNLLGFVYWYMDDPKVGTEWREIGMLIRGGETSMMLAPMPRDRMMVLVLCPATQVPMYRQQPADMWEQALRRERRIADRVAGATRPTRPFTAANLTSFFRASSGPGWVLVGDAGHFKDPIIAQGIGDALAFARRLGEAAAPVLNDRDELDRTLCLWERQRDRESLSTYHLANRESRGEPVQPLVVESLRHFRAAGGYHEFVDVLSKARTLEQVATPLRGAKWLAKALLRPGADRRLLLRQVLTEARISRDVRAELARDEFRPTRPHASQRADWTWPPERDAARAEPAEQPTPAAMEIAGRA